MSQRTGANQRTSRSTPQDSMAWVGWISFAGIMMMLLGFLHAFQGLVALFNDEYYLVGKSGLVVDLDFTAWGWTHLIGGAIVLMAGVGVLQGQVWARSVGVGVAVLSAIVSVGFLAAYPVWSVIMVAIDIIVIMALTVHGSAVKADR